MQNRCRRDVSQLVRREMRHLIPTAFAIVTIFCGGSLQGQTAPSGAAPRDAAANAPYPDEVALSQVRTGEWTYFEAKDQYPLYVSDKDPPGKSACYDSCDMKWIPLLAPPDAKPLGAWTPVSRRGGKRQWAYHRRPVYMLVHDSSDTPFGDGKEGHHLLPTFR